jgi:hypothetical protein
MYLEGTSSNGISAQQRAGHFEMQDTQFLKKKSLKKLKSCYGTTGYHGKNKQINKEINS